MRVPLPGGAKPKLARTASAGLSPSTSSESKAADADDFDLPTQVTPRPLRAAGKLPERGSSAFKATMMGVAPPPSPTKLGASSLSSSSQSMETKAVSTTGASSELAAAKTAGLTSAEQPVPRPDHGRVEAPKRGRNKVAQGTMLGLAPAPPHSGELEAVGFDAAEDPAAYAAKALEAASNELDAEGSDGIPRESATDLSMEIEEEDDDVFGEEEPTLAGGASDLAAFTADDETRVEPLNATSGFQSDPVSAPGEGWSGNHGEALQSSAAEPTALGGDHLQSDETPDWDSADSDVSRQISQSLPGREPAPRKKGRWLLAALVSLVGGVAVVGLLIVQGHVGLPPQVHAKLAELSPDLAARIGTSSASELSASQAAGPVAAHGSAEPPTPRPAANQPTESVNADQGAAADAPHADAPKAIQDPAAPESEAKSAESAKAEPAKAEPARDEPAKAEPARDEPAKAKPAKAEVRANDDDDAFLASAIDEVPDGVRLGTVQDRLYRAKKRAEKCHLSGRAVGEAEVVVTFAPNGRVQSSVVKGEPIASAPVAACIRANMDAVLIPEFEGEPFTVSQSVTLD